MNSTNEISFFCINDYGKIIGEELIERGYNVIFNKLTENTALVIIMGCPTAFNFHKYLTHRYEMERFIYRGKTVYNVFDIPIWRLKYPEWEQYYETYRQMLESGHDIVTISKETTEQLKELWGLDSEPLFRVFNDKLVDKYKKEMPRKKQIIMVSRFVPHKRFDLVMHAIRDTDWKLIMCGRGGESSKYYKDVADSLNIDYEMHMNPSDEFVIEKYCESMVCAQPSVFEGLSLVPKEALWCDTPVILADIPINKEFHAKHVNYFKVDNIADFKKVLNSKLKPAEKTHLETYRIKNITTGVEQWLESLDTK